MTPEALTLAAALLAQPEARLRPAEAPEVAAHVLAAERRHGLPSLLLVAVVLAESGGLRRLVGRHRGKGKRGCDVGAGQIHVPGCDRARVQRLLVLTTNLDRAGSILAGSRETCRRHPRWTACRRSKWALYNGGSRAWWPRVAGIWRRVRGYRADVS